MYPLYQMKAAKKMWELLIRNWVTYRLVLSTWIAVHGSTSDPLSELKKQPSWSLLEWGKQSKRAVLSARQRKGENNGGTRIWQNRRGWQRHSPTVGLNFVERHSERSKKDTSAEWSWECFCEESNVTRSKLNRISVKKKVASTLPYASKAVPGSA